jgi:ABC-type phosphate/phosphonate transport system substrate-binding protein
MIAEGRTSSRPGVSRPGVSRPGVSRGGVSRRGVLAMMLGAGHLLSRVSIAAAESGACRLAISENMMGDVNLNDARAAMSIWIKRMSRDMNVVMDPKVFNTTQEIVERARKGLLDAAALNVIEYRLIADVLDSTQIIAAGGASGLELYVILAKQSSGIRQLGDLKGRRLLMLKTPKMCVAPAWLSTVLDEGHFSPADRFFGTVTADAKVSRVVLPVFFGQADCCLTSKRGFDTMCELNPQVARDLQVITSSPAMVVDFYIFRRGYQGATRESVIRAISGLTATESGRQLATLFQFHELAIRDGKCLASALGVLEGADRISGQMRGRKP